MPWNAFKSVERLKVNAGCFLEAFSDGKKVFQVNMVHLVKIENILFLQIDQSCSYKISEKNLEDEYLNEILLLHCTCPGCRTPFNLDWIDEIVLGVLLIVLVVLLLVVSIHKKTRYVNKKALHIINSVCQYDRLENTSV